MFEQYELPKLLRFGSLYPFFALIAFPNLELHAENVTLFFPNIVSLLARSSSSQKQSLFPTAFVYPLDA